MENIQVDLQGKVAVVTGGTGNIGGAFCRGLAANGAKVAILSRSANDDSEIVKTLRADGYEAIGISTNVTDLESIQAAKDKIIQQWQTIDILVNCAGGHDPRAITSPDRSFFDLAPDGIQFVLDANLMSSLLVTQVFAKPMTDQGEGVIINISSMAATQPMTRVAAYAAAKAAIDNFTKWLATHMAKEYSAKIRVNAIAPGFFISHQNHDLLIDRDTGNYTSRGQDIINNTPMGRFGEADELIGVLLWLVSDAARFVTGIIVPVDGGFSAFSGV